MPRKFWLQYHSFEQYGVPGLGCIDTNKDEFLTRHKNLQFGEDVILLMIGLKPTRSNLMATGLPLSLRKIDTTQRLYCLWSKFIAEDYDYLGQKQFGGFDYAIFGDEMRCVSYQQHPIVFRSPEFKEFWASYNRHGFLCLSDYGCPFPELEEIDEGLVFIPGRGSAQSKLGISEKVVVPKDVCAGLTFIKQKLPRQQLCLWAEVDQTLRRYGYTTTANWIKSHQREYLAAWQVGFEAQAES